MIPEFLKEQITLEKTASKTENAYLFSAFAYDEQITMTLRLPREIGCSDPVLELYRDDDGAKFVLPMLWEEEDTFDCLFERYSLTFKAYELCKLGGKNFESGLFYYTVSFDSAYARHRISRRCDSYKNSIMYADCHHAAFQLTVYSEIYSPPKGFEGGIMYHIFVDRFCKGGDYPVREDAIFNPDWENGCPQFAEYRGGFVANNMFFGGTLKGIESKLDYLKELSVSIIYLSPIFEAYSNHKYDTGRYDRVDPMFGGDEALDSLIKAAHKRGIKIILDMVFNHTGSDSIYFNKNGRYPTLGAYQSVDSPYYSWYDFEEYPDKYRCWWGVDILPAVDTKNESYNEYINGENGIAERYLKKGIDGYRLDVADELDMSFLEDLTAAVKGTKDGSLIIGEVWEDASCKEAYGTRRRYFRGRQLDSVMNYPLRNGIIKFVKEGDNRALFEGSAYLYQNYPKFVSDNLMNFLGTHDTERVLTVLGTAGEQGMSAKQLSEYKMGKKERDRAISMLKNAYTILAFMPGIPCIYYGDEAGMEGFRDPFNRMPYPWGRQNRQLLDHYKKIGALRRSRDIFASGYFEIDENTPKGVLVFRRFDKTAEITIAVNCSDGAYILQKNGTMLASSQGGEGKKGEYFVVDRGEYAVVDTSFKKKRKM